MKTNSQPTGWIAPALMLLTLACGGSGAGDTSANTEAGEAAIEEEGGIEVHLDSDALALSGVTVGTAEMVGAGSLAVTGDITYDQNRVSHIGPKIEGRVVELMVEVGSDVREGAVLGHLESPEVGTTRAELHEAESLLEIARENYSREQRLEAQGISSRRELLDAEAELRRMEARVRGAEERLRVFGADLHGEGGHFDVASPYDGVVVERHAGRGEVVGPSDHLFTIADLSRLWIELDVYERDLSVVAVGQPVVVETTAWPGRDFSGRIVYVGDILDPVRRSVRARVEVVNEGRLLKPGMFARARIETSDDRSVVAVPRDAVQSVEGTQVVWVPGEEPGEFLARPVQTGRDYAGDLIEIVSGLAPGDSLVVVGAFTLKAELAKGEFGGHGH